MGKNRRYADFYSQNKKYSANGGPVCEIHALWDW